MITTFATMTNSTDTQEVTQSAEARTVLAQVLTPNAVPRPAAQPVQAAVPAPAQPVEPAAPAAPAATATTAPVEPAVVAATPAVPATPNPYDAVVDKMFASQPVATSWDDNSKAAFKATFGAEDPAAYKAQVQADLEQGNLWKSKYEEVAPVVQQIQGLAPTAHKIVQLALNGKLKEAQDYLKSTPLSLLEGKTSKEVDKLALTKTYFPDKFTEEQWGMFTDPEADKDMVDALNTRLDILHASAVDKHDAALLSASTEKQQEEAERAQYAEKYHASVATSISTAKNSPLSAFLDQGTIGEIQSGAFLNKYVNPDGTPTSDSATLHLYALHGQRLAEAAEARGYARGKSEGMQDATSRMPAGPTGSGRSAGDPPKNPTEKDQVRGIMWSALQRT